MERSTHLARIKCFPLGLYRIVDWWEPTKEILSAEASPPELSGLGDGCGWQVAKRISRSLIPSILASQMVNWQTLRCHPVYYPYCTNKGKNASRWGRDWSKATQPDREESDLTPLQALGLVFLPLPHLGWSSTASIPVRLVQKQQQWAQAFSLLALVLWMVWVGRSLGSPLSGTTQQRVKAPSEKNGQGLALAIDK